MEGLSAVFASNQSDFLYQWEFSLVGPFLQLPESAGQADVDDLADRAFIEGL